MRIAMGAGSEVLGTPMRPQDVVGDVVAAEAEGFGSAWTVHFSRGVDALGVLAVAGTRTSRIDLGVGIVPTYPRHPLALAQQAATAQAFCGGRLTLGVGVSHRPVIEDLHGLAYQQPAAHMRDYLSVLVPLLREGSVRHRGAFYQVDGGFVVPGTSPVSVLVGALSPLMVQAAGELADGVVTWLAGPRTLGEQIIPRLHRAFGSGASGSGASGSGASGSGASGSGASGSEAATTRAAPRVVAALPVALTPGPGADSGTARQTADEVFARYAGFDNYRRLLEREGATSPGALAVTGTEAGIEKQLSRLASLGVTELWPIIFPVGDDPVRSRRETRALLRSLATSAAPQPAGG
jgi:5,10-methylenetetrahydromethanopterin reductase